MAREKTRKLSRNSNRQSGRDRLCSAINTLLTVHNVSDEVDMRTLQKILKLTFGIRASRKSISDALDEVLAYYYKIEEYHDYPEDY